MTAGPQAHSIDDLIREEIIGSIEVPLGPMEQPERLLYGFPGFIEWLDDRLRADEPSPLGADLSPAQQLDNLFYQFVSGRPLVFTRQFRYIKAEKEAVWEFKTPDLRVFGWFPKKDCFICVFGNFADVIKDHDLYRGYRLEIRRLRREMGIESVTSLDPEDVLS